MNVEKRSEFVKAWGNTFEVPPRTKWLTIDFRGYVFASEHEDKPVPCESSEGKPMVWDHHGHGFYVGKIRMFKYDWKEMIVPVGSERFRLSKHVENEVGRVIDYCAEKIEGNSMENSAYFSHLLRVLHGKMRSSFESKE